MTRRLRFLLGGKAVLLVDRNALYTVVLQQRQALTHNVCLLRFSLENSRQKLGIQPGQHVLLHAWICQHLVTRPYTPVTFCDQRGHFDVVVKVYNASAAFPTGGLMSQYLDRLLPGSIIQVQGPRGRFIYEGRGQFVLRGGRRLKRATQIGMIAAGSGVTPMLQLLHHVIESCDRTHMVLVNVNATEDDIIAREKLDWYALRFSANIRIWHVLSKLPLSDVPKNFVQGPLTKSIVAALLPPPDPKTVVLCCGPPGLLYDVCKPALKNIGHDATQVLIF
ncbi:hypothetical protein HPB49_012816 [Dermacentor silvarum]|uniref:Uncharacterized protein n=1 Tax=Dermacentor silvarum TaxID=543639 RepID=A0ACB8C9G1_DERSI|nr:hypothetical protein HPB49_012816 [Dermacentor silvarum]